MTTKYNQLIQEITYLLTTQRKKGLTDHQIATKIVHEIIGKEINEFSQKMIEKFRDILSRW